MAGGIAEGFQPDDAPIPKPLLPINGKPVSEFVIHALEQSNVEKIFIVQDEGAGLEQALTYGPKCVFINKEKAHASLGMGLFFAMERVAEYYDPVELKDRSIMFVPCDIPLVTKDTFNRLITLAAGAPADVTITIISTDLLDERFPGKSFRGIYLSEYRSTYTMQNVIFVDGGFIQLRTDPGPGNLRFSFRGWDDKVLDRVVAGIDSIQTLRRRSHFYDKLFLIWLLTKGYSGYIFKFLMDLLLKRATMARIIQYLNGADHMQAGYIVSEEAECSADIDSPEDLHILVGNSLQNG